MTTTISPDQYCNHPEDYKNFAGIDDTTRTYWDQYCQLKKQISSQKLPDSKEIANAIPQALEKLVLGVFSPQGLEMLAVFIGTPIVYKYLIRNFIGFGIKNLLTKAELELAEKFILEGGNKYIANGCSVLSKCFSGIAFVDVEIATKAGYSGGKYAVAKLLESLGELFDLINPVMDALFIIQLIGMVFDAWDPCNLNLELDADQLQEFSNAYNNQFRTHVLASIETSINSYGHVSINTAWPIEYYAEKSALLPFKNDYYDPIRQSLFMKYINTLRVNSDGEPIRHEQGGRLITNNDISKIQLATFSAFSNGNTMVENWLLNWWPIIVGILVLLLIIFIVIKNNKKKNV